MTATQPVAALDRLIFESSTMRFIEELDVSVCAEAKSVIHLSHPRKVETQCCELTETVIIEFDLAKTIISAPATSYLDAFPGALNTIELYNATVDGCR